MKRKLISPPEKEPVELVEAKAHLRIDHDYEDDLIYSMITAAREYCETMQKRVYLTQTWGLYMDHFKEEVTLPLPPLQSVNTVKYKDSDGLTHELPNSEYDVDDVSEPSRLIFYNLPSVNLYRINPICIEIKVGHDHVDKVPKKIKQAILLLVAAWYENREAFAPGQMNEIPFSVNALLWQDRVF